MKKSLKLIKTGLLALFICLFGIVSHASALANTTYGIGEHKTSGSPNCTSLCAGAPSDKMREIRVDEDDDDEPAQPYYLQFASAQTSWVAEKRITAQTVDDGDKIPIYRSCCVIRR